MTNIFTICVLNVIAFQQATCSMPLDGILSDSEQLYNIQELKSRLETIVRLASTTLPRLTQNYEYQIQEITKGMKLASILSSLRDETSTILQSASVPVIKCSSLTANRMDSLTNSAKASVTICSQEAEEEIEKLTIQIDNILKTATDLLSVTTFTTEQCVTTNLINQLNLAKCLAGVVLNAASTLLELESDVMNTLGSAEQIAGETVLIFGACLARIESETVTLSGNIINDVQNCINTNI